MRADLLMENGSIISFSNIVNIDLSYYDDLFVVRSKTPEFKVSFSYDHTANDPFAIWWKDYIANGANISLFVSIYDNDDLLLADGTLYEWEDKFEDFELEFTCVPKISEFLDKTISIKKENTIQAYYSSADKSFLSHWIEFFRRLWFEQADIKQPRVAIFNDNGVPIESNSTTSLEYLVEKTKEFTQNMATGNHILRITTGSMSNITRRAFLRDLAKALLIKIIYVSKLDRFEFHLNNDLTPTIINGYVKSVYLNVKKHIEPSNLFSKIEIFVGGSNEGNIASHFNDIINHRLNILKQKEEYSIWGYAGKIIITGETISLNNTRYIVSEIAYEKETIDNIKSFNAVCVKYT